ncbi:MAG: hypothetical protein JRJ14_03775 [Deltaproteobacteria bacterium]|nr:hypothetical protein [Deltaproteobacteria bacterium]
MPLHHAPRAVARVVQNAVLVQQQPEVYANLEVRQAVAARPEAWQQVANAGKEIRLLLNAKQVAHQGHKLPLFIPARPEG